MLIGTWRIVALTDNGDPIGPELIRRKIARNATLEVSDRLVSHVNPENGEVKSSPFTVNPTRFPRTIDLITPDDRMLTGIYKFEGDDLVVCYNTREGRPRPVDFVSPGGNFVTLMRLQVADGPSPAMPSAEKSPAAPARSEDLQSDTPSPSKARQAKFSAAFRLLNDERKPTQSELDRDRQLLAGTWRVQAIVDDGQSLSADLIREKIADGGVIKIGVRGISSVSPQSDAKRLWAYRINPAPSPSQIDITTQFDTLLKGIYKFEGDRLLICLAKVEEHARPTSFDAPDGSGQILYKLKMVGEREDSASAAAEPESKPEPRVMVRARQTTVTPAPQPAPQPAPKPVIDEKARIEQEIRGMLIGSWSMTDRKGNLVMVFRPDGSFTSTRTYAKRRLFEPDVVTSSGIWSYGRGIVSASVQSTNDRDMLGHGIVSRIQSISEDAMVATDNIGQLMTLRKIR